MLLIRRFIFTPLLLLYRPLVSFSSTQSIGIIDLILSEHKYMRDEYEHFKSIDNTNDLDPRVHQWIEYISLHGHKEEIAFYPKIEKYLNNKKKDGYDLIKHGIKEHRELELELKKLTEQSHVNWKQIHKAVKKLLHHLDEEEKDILKPLHTKLDKQFQIELAQEFINAGQLASHKPHPELTKLPEKAAEENIQIGLAEKHKDL